ncbi:MAG: hypothetical protein VXX66_03260, partial [Actinomycetota bacterium]|nr:hypothetical protein [Actinomycetota bacterium]
LRLGSQVAVSCKRTKYFTYLHQNQPFSSNQHQNREMQCQRLRHGWDARRPLDEMTQGGVQSEQISQ